MRTSSFNSFPRFPHNNREISPKLEHLTQNSVLSDVGHKIGPTGIFVNHLLLECVIFFCLITILLRSACGRKVENKTGSSIFLFRSVFNNTSSQLSLKLTPVLGSPIPVLGMKVKQGKSVILLSISTIILIKSTQRDPSRPFHRCNC